MVNISLTSLVGAEDVYLAQQNQGLRIQGLDYVGNAFKYFEENVSDELKSKIKLSQGDWYNMDKSYYNKFDGVISLETLSWLEDWKLPIEKIIEINPKWMAFSSLFYEGKINYQVQIRDYEFSESVDGYDIAYYNIYSIPLIKSFLAQHGYAVFDFERFEIDIDLPKPSHMGTGTYTIKTETNERLQVSGAMLMPWYFIYAEK